LVCCCLAAGRKAAVREGEAVEPDFLRHGWSAFQPVAGRQALYEDQAALPGRRPPRQCARRRVEGIPEGPERPGGGRYRGLRLGSPGRPGAVAVRALPRCPGHDWRTNGPQRLVKVRLLQAAWPMPRFPGPEEAQKLVPSYREGGERRRWIHLLMTSPAAGRWRCE
jgi:hypothetical protein